jgi:general secretion pathway protein A
LSIGEANELYKTFFHLHRNPFEISPDPRFFYPTSRHNEAFANLCYAIQVRKGFVVLTGEVGTGKTLLLRCLLQKLEKYRVQCAFVFNPVLEPTDFLRYIAADLGLRGDFREKSTLLARLSELLIRYYSQGRIAVLIVDEAHLLSREALEEIRLLGNLETHKGKLLQIALVGQPELDEKLDSPGLRQLKQRIALRCQLQALSWEETRDYVDYRLKRAGANGGPPLFPESSLRAVYRFSGGYPRLINTICENSLISACAAGTETVPVEFVEEACRDLRISPASPPDASQKTQADSACPPSASASDVSKKNAADSHPTFAQLHDDGKPVPEGAA